jgi:hypothetical protein
MKTEISDAQIIAALGGPAKLARKLGLMNRQTVQAWIKRGIPAYIKLNNARLIAKGRRLAND